MKLYYNKLHQVSSFPLLFLYLKLQLALPDAEVAAIVVVVAVVVVVIVVVMLVLVVIIIPNETSINTHSIYNYTLTYVIKRTYCNNHT